MNKAIIISFLLFLGVVGCEKANVDLPGVMKIECKNVITDSDEIVDDLSKCYDEKE